MKYTDSRSSEKKSAWKRTNDCERATSPSNARSGPVASLHRTVGNQAVQAFVENELRDRSTSEPAHGGEETLQRSTDEPSVRERGLDERVQPKLEIGDPDSRYEREADRVAEQVMRMADPTREVDTREEVRPDRIQRMCSRCQRRFQQGKPLNCEECEEEVQRTERSAKTPEVDATLAEQIRSLRGGGTPLPDGVRSFLEPRFGEDFSDVHVHTGSRADEAARSVNATAFTVGTDVVFRSGAYRPGTDGGRRLLAHELTHVVQQRGARPRAKGHGDGVSAGRPERAPGLVRTGVAPSSIQRDCKDGKWRFECDGCSMPEKYRDKVADKDNPTGHPDTVFGNESPTGLCEENYTAPCDEHDRCYQTCRSERTEDGWQYDLEHKAACDQAFYDDMMAVCRQAGDPEGTVDILGWNPNCSTYARVYYQAVKYGGGDAFRRRQREACECEAQEPEETEDTEEDGPIELEPTQIEGKVYTVTPGDTLWDIAEREYGDGQKWPVIFEANRKTEEHPDGIEDPDRIYPGQTLVIPSQSEADAFDRSEYERPR